MRSTGWKSSLKSSPSDSGRWLLGCRFEDVQRKHIDGFVQVTDEEAISTARRLACEEGIFAGFSSAANIAAALKLLPGRAVVTLINDSGLKYLTTELWA